MFIAEATLDFHDLGLLTREQIEAMTLEFLDVCYRSDHDSVLIITGKGKSSEHGLVVRPVVEKTLRQDKFVKSFKTAAAARGGASAFEVYFT